MTITELRLHEATFRAFGSNCRVVSDVEASIQAAVSRLEDLESRWSRFRDDSEVSEVNRRSGQWCEVSAITTDLFARTLEASVLTNRVFNPLMLSQMHALGYAHSHELLHHTSAPSDTSRSPEPASPHSIEIEGAGVRIPVGTAFDPGGIGKGLAADLVMADLIEAGATWALASLGGDMAFGGAALLDSGLVAHIDDPRQPNHILGTTRVAGGALATSSTTGRRWATDGEVHHHLLDPVTGLPARTPRIAASVYAPRAWMADVVAKALVISPKLTLSDLAIEGVEAVVFTEVDVIDMGLPVEPVIP